MKDHFWKHRSLNALSPDEWEALCDRCGQCCLLRLENEATGDRYVTSLSCEEYDCQTGGCRHYEERQERVPDCVRVTPENIASLTWLPDTCAYRRIYNGLPLPEWHPLVCGDSRPIRDSDLFAGRFARSMAGVPEEEWEDHIIAKCG